jgi:hypothetical protein
MDFSSMLQFFAAFDPFNGRTSSHFYASFLQHGQSCVTIGSGQSGTAQATDFGENQKRHEIKALEISHAYCPGSHQQEAVMTGKDDDENIVEMKRWKQEAARKAAAAKKAKTPGTVPPRIMRLVILGGFALLILWLAMPDNFIETIRRTIAP